MSQVSVTEPAGTPAENAAPLSVHEVTPAQAAEVEAEAGQAPVAAVASGAASGGEA
jgi:hypothetical protein